MEIFDTLASKTHKRAYRVRSWYLYEQFKALEKHQTEATQTLKHKSQDQRKLLHRELKERRARRRLVDKFDIPNESHIQRVASDVQTCVSGISESSHDSQNEKSQNANHAGDSAICNSESLKEAPGGTQDAGDTSSDCGRYDFNAEDTGEGESYDTCNCSNKCPGEVCNNCSANSEYAEEVPDNESISRSEENVSHDLVTSSLSNNEFRPFTYTDLVDNIKDEIVFAKEAAGENMNFQLDTVEHDNMQYQPEADELPDEDSSANYDDGDDDDISVKQPPLLKQNKSDNNLYTAWSKLVSFAYQVINLNHGNCYYDYSSQFLTAVLACDILRRCLKRMCEYAHPTIVVSCNSQRCELYLTLPICNILQPYVSPVNLNAVEKVAKHNSVLIFCESTTAPVEPEKDFKRKKSMRQCKSPPLSQSPIIHCYCGGDGPKKTWRPSTSYTGSYYTNPRFTTSDPWRRTTETPFISLTNKISSSIWPEELGKISDEDSVLFPAKVANPMLKLASQIDSLDTMDFM